MKKINKGFCIKRLLLCLLCAACLSGCGDSEYLLLGEASVTDTESMEEEAFAENEPEEVLIFVHVCGQVVNPGVYGFEKGTRAEAAVAAAGGFTQAADPEYVNLAEVLQDGEKLYFPSVQEVEEQRIPYGQLPENGGNTAGNGDGTQLVNINTAEEALLCTLPGIGESKAKDIISYRKKHGDFKKCEDIMKVSGIKESLYEKLEDYICVE